MKLGTTLFGLLLAEVFASANALAQTNADRGAFILVQRGDTVAIERFARTADSVAADLVVKAQGRIVYVGKIAPDFTFSRMTLQFYLPSAAPDAPPVQTAVLTMKGDSVIAEIGAGAQKQTQRLKTVAGAVMLPRSTTAAFEQLTMMLRAHKPPLGPTDSMTVPIFATSGGATVNVSLKPLGRDSVIASGAGQVYRLAVDASGRILGGVEPTASLSISRVDAATAAKLSLGKPDYSAPADAPYVAEEVTIPISAGMLGGTLTLPRNAKSKVPAVVTITGSGQQDRDEYIPVAGGYRPFRQIADTLSRRGIAVLRLDDRGIGASTASPMTSTSADFADDIRAAIAYLRTRSDIDPARIALIGHSEGGLIAPIVAATDKRLKGIVLMAGPADNGRKIIRYQQRYAVEHDTTLTAAKRDSLLRVGQAQLDSLADRNPWTKFFLTYDPTATARKVTAPVLILQGANDRQVTADQAPRLAAAFRAGGNRDVTVHVFPNRNHLFLTDPDGNPQGYTRLTVNKIDGEVLGVLADWLVKRLGG